MFFKYALALPPHSSFRILSHRIAPNSTLNGCDNNGQQGTSNLTIKICLVNLYISRNDNNVITVGKAYNEPMKVINGIEGNANKVKIAPRKMKQPNLEVMKYIKGGKHPEEGFGKYVYAIR